MSRMKDLFGDTPYNPKQPCQVTRASDPATSFAAGISAINNLKELQRIVYDVHCGNPQGLTDYELEELCENHGSTYRTRRAELVEVGLLYDSGQTRLINGRKRIVWKARAR